MEINVRKAALYGEWVASWVVGGGVVPPIQPGGTGAPVMEARMGCASPQERGMTGMLGVVLRTGVLSLMHWAMRAGEGSPGQMDRNCTEPRCTPDSGRHGPSGYTDPFLNLCWNGLRNKEFLLEIIILNK
jgi:hypothetical protein